MEHFEKEPMDPSNPIVIDDKMKLYLDEYGKWGKILAIISFIGIGLAIILMLIALIFMGFGGQYFGNNSSFISSTFMIVVYLALMGIYIFPTLYLYRSSTAVRYAVRQDDVVAFDKSFRNLKNLFKFISIITLIVIGLYGIIAVLALFGGMGAFPGQ